MSKENLCCQSMSSILKKELNSIKYNPAEREYGIEYTDGTSSLQLINFCPFCGNKLPASLSDRWFLELEQLGYDDPLNQEIPEKFKSEEWWLDMKLYFFVFRGGSSRGRLRPFGNMISETGPALSGGEVANKLRYTGREFDRETGLLAAGAMGYSATSIRWGLYTS